MSHFKSIVTLLIIATLSFCCKEEKKEPKTTIETITTPQIDSAKRRRSTGIMLKRAIRETTKTTNRVKIDSLMNDLMIIKENSFFRIALGDSLTNFKSVLEKDILNNLEVYYLYDEQGDKLAAIHPESQEKEVVKSIEILSSKAKTINGIGIGMTFDDLLKVNPKIKINNSESNGQTYATNKSITYILDATINSKKLDNSEINSAIKIKSISIH